MFNSLIVFDRRNVPNIIRNYSKRRLSRVRAIIKRVRLYTTTVWIQSVWGRKTVRSVKKRNKYDDERWWYQLGRKDNTTGTDAVYLIRTYISPATGGISNFSPVLFASSPPCRVLHPFTVHADFRVRLFSRKSF